MSTLIDEAYVKLEEKYSKEVIEYVYNNFFSIMKDVFKGKLASSIYISNLGSFFLSANLIKYKIAKYKRMKLETKELEELLEFSKTYSTNNKKWRS